VRKAGYELYDHTADLGIRVHAATLPELVWPATQALYAAIGELRPRDAEAESRPIDLADEDAALLLRDYLAQLLRWFEIEKRIAVEADIREFTPQRLAGRVRVAPVDLDASLLSREVKAVTYHALALRPIAGGFEFSVIVDI